MKTNRKVEQTSDAVALPSYSRLLALANQLERYPADAEDLLQDAYVRLLASPADEIRDVVPWMRSVMKNLRTDKIRRNALQDRFVALSLNDPSREQPTPATTVVEQRLECALVLNVMVERLDSHELAALLLREVFELSYRELCEALGKSEQAARQMVHRAGRRIRSNREFEHRWSHQRRRRRDEAQLSRTYLICLHALTARDPGGLHALVNAPRINASLHRSSHARSSQRMVGSVIQHVSGNLSMSLVLDGVVLCVIPLGVTHNAADVELEA